MKPQFKLEQIYLDLSKLSEDQRKYVGEVTDTYKIQKFFKPFPYLFFDNRFSIWNQCTHHDSDLLKDKTELTYSQFLDMMGESKEKSKVIENSEKELINNDGTIYIGEGLENYYKDQLERTGKFKVVSIDATSEEVLQVENTGWIEVNDALPLCVSTGNWDGNQSEIILAETITGKKFLAQCYEGFMDGSDFYDWYQVDEINSNDWLINESVSRWMKIPV